MAKTIQEILEKYYNEAVGGIVQKAPSALNRGEATEIEYFIYKIDLVSSTLFTKNRTHKTYLKLAHTFLSTVDEITRDYGADEDQTEYAGDSVIAYFRTDDVDAIDVLEAAFYCRKAALEMRKLDTTLGGYPFLTKTVIHYGKLIMAKIGPRGNWMVSAIGPELHKACKMEKNVLGGGGRASKEFVRQLEGKQRLLLEPNYKDTQVLKQPEITTNIRKLSLAEAFGRTSSPGNLLDMTPNVLAEITLQKGIASPRNSLSALFAPTQTNSLAPQYVTERELIDYSIKWDLIPKYFEMLRR